MKQTGRAGAVRRYSEHVREPVSKSVFVYSMTEPQPNNPLHGLTLEAMLTRLVDHYGWAGLGKRIAIKCFTSDPSLPSSLKFLRRTPWARSKVEELYLRTRWSK